MGINVCYYPNRTPLSNVFSRTRDACLSRIRHKSTMRTAKSKRVSGRFIDCYIRVSQPENPCSRRKGPWSGRNRLLYKQGILDKPCGSSRAGWGIYMHSETLIGRTEARKSPVYRESLRKLDISFTIRRMVGQSGEILEKTRSMRRLTSWMNGRPFVCTAAAALHERRRERRRQGPDCTGPARRHRACHIHKLPQVTRKAPQHHLCSSHEEAIPSQDGHTLRCS